MAHAVRPNVRAEDFAMDLNRNQFFLAGVVILMLGIQFRIVETFVLNEPTSQFVSKNLKHTPAKSSTTSPTLLSVPTTSPAGLHNVRPPKWVGWALISVGAVLILHSLAMPRPS